MHRFNLVLSDREWNAMKEMFPDETASAVIRKAIRLLVMVAREQPEGGHIVIRGEKTEREIVVL